jgi:hypothetical protein
MAAASYDFEIEQGATLVKSFVWKTSDDVVIPLTSYTARMQIRASVSSPDILLELSTANGLISISPSEGKVTLTAGPTVTSVITWRRGKYDLELTSPTGVVTRLLYGDITVSQEVTR